MESREKQKKHHTILCVYLFNAFSKFKFVTVRIQVSFVRHCVFFCLFLHIVSIFVVVFFCNPFIFLCIFLFFIIADFYQNDVDNRFYCTVCSRNYVRKKHVMRHIRYECINVPSRFHCADCSKCYRQSNALLNHIRQKHGPLARDTSNSNGFTQRNFNVTADGEIIFSAFR